MDHLGRSLAIGASLLCYDYALKPFKMEFLPLTPEDVNHIAMLARLGIDERDIPAYASNLSRIIEFVDQLNEAETDAVEPMAHPLAKPQRLRGDEVAEEDRRELYQRNAPAVEEALYTVPRVIE